MADLPAHLCVSHDLDPRLREAVRLYTDPLMPTFGMAGASERAAGYAESSCDGRHLRLEKAQAEIQRIQELRAEAGSEAAKYMGDFAFDAARELIDQLHAGKELEVVDPTKYIDGEDPRMLREISTHNRTVQGFLKDRRDAAIKILEYKLGTPEQRVRHTHAEEQPDPLDLEQLEPDELAMLARAVQEVRDKKKKPPLPAESIDEEEGPSSEEIAEAEFEVISS